MTGLDLVALTSIRSHSKLGEAVYQSAFNANAPDGAWRSYRYHEGWLNPC